MFYAVPCVLLCELMKIDQSSSGEDVAHSFWQYKVYKDIK